MKENPNPGRMYVPGDLIAVPLDRGGYGVSLVADRWLKHRRGSSIIAIFGFNQIFRRIPSTKKLQDLLPTDVICIKLCIDRAITTGRWKWVGHLHNFAPGDWPQPPVLNHNVVELHKVDRWKFAELPVKKYVKKSQLKLLGYSPDGMCSWGYFEQALDRAIRDRHPEDYFPVIPKALDFWKELYRLAEQRKRFK